jgi:hypothetical protein
MRKVAGYLLSTNVHPDNRRARLELVDALVEKWLASKGERTDEGSKATIRYQDGRRAEYRKAVTPSEHGTLIEHFLVEPTDVGMFETFIALGEDGAELAAYIELRAAGDAYHIEPVHFDVRCPQIVRSLIDCGESWAVADTPVTSRPMAFKGSNEALTLIEVVWHRERNLPVIAITPHEGAQLTENFAESLAADLSGLALIVTLDEEATWALTRARGKEWSCYNGAVRLYWPMGPKFDSPFAHPLWTHSALMRGMATPQDASSRLRRQLRNQIIGLSAFSVLQPPFFQLIRRKARQSELEELRQKGAGAEEWQGIAEEYAKDNDELRTQKAELGELVRDLRARVAALELALRWKEGAKQEQSGDATPESDFPPATVAEAVERAREQAGKHLLFGEDVQSGIESLVADAGPPDKILQYLKHLRDLGAALETGNLGTTTIQWLRDRGVNASGESDTVRRAAVEMRKRTWHDGIQRRPFELHLKPNDNASPDRCARIYFDYDQSRRCIVVGWVGRHP